MEKINRTISGLFFLLAFGLFLFAWLNILDTFGINKLSFVNFFKNDLSVEQIKEENVNQLLFFNKGDSRVNMLIGDYFKETKDFKKAEYFYRQALEFNSFIGYKVYKNLFDILENQERIDEKEKLLIDLHKKFKNQGYISYFSANLAKDLYSTGAFYLKNEANLEKTIFWWSMARDILPEWSYFHLELVSLYSYSGQKEKAIEALNFCINFTTSAEHCSDYLKNDFHNLMFIYEPGYWQNEILKIER